VANRTGNRSFSGYSRVGFVNRSKAKTNSSESEWILPLGRTPDYLDPQSQEALHEVDVSGTSPFFAFGQAPEGETIGSSG